LKNIKAQKVKKISVILLVHEYSMLLNVTVFLFQERVIRMLMIVEHWCGIQKLWRTWQMKNVST